MELARQYGGYGGLYGGGYGGYVECCEGVVDPILLLGVIVGNYCTLIVLCFTWFPLNSGEGWIEWKNHLPLLFFFPPLSVTQTATILSPFASGTPHLVPASFSG